MDNKQKREWREHNQILQQAYHDYNATRVGKSASLQKAKENALNRIEQLLDWPPFLNFYCEQVGNVPSNFVRYDGIEYLGERCIEQIDKIAQEEINYDY